LRVGATSIVLLALAGAGVAGLAELTQSRPDRHTPGGRSELVVAVRTKRGYRSENAARNLWGACQWTVQRASLTSVDALGQGRYRLHVDTDLGVHDRRRLRGCLEDGTLDRVWADVIELRVLRPT
jgi:hypothetical protein